MPRFEDEDEYEAPQEWHPMLGVMVEKHAKNLRTRLGRHFPSFVPSSQNYGRHFQGGFAQRATQG